MMYQYHTYLNCHSRIYSEPERLQMVWREKTEHKKEKEQDSNWKKEHSAEGEQDSP